VECRKEEIGRVRMEYAMDPCLCVHVCIETNSEKNSFFLVRMNLADMQQICNLVRTR